MSNLISIEIIESRVAGTNGPFEFSVVASDSYGSVSDKGYASIETLMESYPTRLELLEWLELQSEFSGAFSCDGANVILNSASAIEFNGYPEDDSISEIKHKDSAKSIGCYVEVTGEATDEDDEGVQGFYLIQLQLSREIDLSKASANEKSEIAKAALDCFHDHQGVCVLEDFEITTCLADGTCIYEEDGFEEGDLVKSTAYQGDVGLSGLPFLPDSQVNRFWTDVVPYFGLDTSFDYNSNPERIKEYLADFDSEDVRTQEAARSFEKG